MVDFADVMQKCGLVELKNISRSVRKIITLEKHYTRDELVLIYNYILSNVKNSEILMHTIRCADKIRDNSTLDALLDILLMKNNFECSQEEKDNFINVRAMSAKAIAHLKDTTAVTPLLYCLNNKEENYKIRLACADALGKLGDRYAVAPLIEVVTDQNERSVYVKESAACALGLIGDVRAIEPLVNILNSSKGILNRFTFLKERVIEALGKLGSSEFVFTALKNSLVDDSAQVRISAIEAIMNSENPKSSETIKPLLQDKDEEVRKNALIALYNLDGRDILDEVISLPIYPDSLKEEAENLIDEYEEEYDVKRRN
ncbi:MAG: HEAT repeat domain-containing protein [Fusobacterium sp.]|nr:HEAT repeat domain-containing protein [Fusobacterium sp.]